jgi:hypothetical protein
MASLLSTFSVSTVADTLFVFAFSVPLSSAANAIVGIMAVMTVTHK